MRTIRSRLGASIRLKACKDFLRGCDVVLAIGTELAESDLWEAPPLALTGQLVRIDIDPAQLPKNAPTELGIVADARLALAEIVAQLEPSPRPARSLGATREAILHEALHDGAAYRPLVDALRRALPDDAIIAGDSAQVCYYVDHLVPAEHRRPFGAIREEYELTMKELLRLRGEHTLLDTDPVLQRTLRVRDAYLVPIHYLQVALAERRRAEVESGREPARTWPGPSS